MRQLAVRTGVIHRGGEILRQEFAELIDGDVESRGQLLDRVAAEHLLQLLGGDREVLTVSEPGFDLIAKAGLLELGDDRRESALAAVAEHLAQHDRDHRRLKLAEGAFERR